MEAVLAVAIGIALEYHGLHVVVQDAARHAARGCERALMAADRVSSFMSLTKSTSPARL
jgi:hypothetical protein